MTDIEDHLATKRKIEKRLKLRNYRAAAYWMLNQAFAGIGFMATILFVIHLF